MPLHNVPPLPSETTCNGEIKKYMFDVDLFGYCPETLEEKEDYVALKVVVLECLGMLKRNGKTRQWHHPAP